MAVRSVSFPGSVTAGTQFIGSGAGLSAYSVPRSSIAGDALAADYVVINGPVNGYLSSVAQLTVPMGGTGVAAITGVVKGNAGAAMSGMTGTAWGATYWEDSSTIKATAAGTANQILQSNGAAAPTWVSPSTNITAGNGLTWGGTNTLAMINPVTTAIGGTGANLINNVAAGVLVLTGAAGSRTVTVAQVTDTEVSNSAAISRSKLALGTFNGVVINSGTGAMTDVAQLAVTMGGTGASAAISGMVKGGTPSMTGVTGTQYGVTYWADANTIASTPAGATGYFLTATTGAAPGWTSPSTFIAVDSTLQWTLGVLGMKTPVSTSIGGTGANLSSASTTGFAKMTGLGGSETMTIGNVFNVDIDTNAAIDRSKIAVGTPDHIVVNAAITGALSSIAQLTVPLGGTGASTLTGMVKGNAAGAFTAITGTQYGATYWSGTNTIGSTAQGTNGYILRANGAGAPTWDTPSGVIIDGTGLTWAGSTLNLDVPVTTANGGTGSTTLGSASLNGFVKMTGVSPNEVMAVALVTNTDIDTGAAIARSKIESVLGSANHVVINDGLGALSSESHLALSRGGTNATLASDPVNRMILQFTPTATSVSTIIGTNASTANTVVVRDASGNASFNSVTSNSSTGPTIAAPTTSATVSVTGSISTSSGVTAAIIQITTAIGYAGSVRCIVTAADATAAQNYAFFEAVWFWKRTGAGLEFNTAPSSKVYDKSNGVSLYDITASISGTSIRINASQGVLATTLFWTGNFTIVHNQLS